MRTNMRTSTVQDGTKTQREVPLLLYPFSVGSTFFVASIVIQRRSDDLEDLPLTKQDMRIFRGKKGGHAQLERSSGGRRQSIVAGEEVETHLAHTVLLLFVQRVPSSQRLPVELQQCCSKQPATILQ